MALYLIVANQTIGGEQLTEKLDELVSAGPCTFRFLVPVTDTEGTHQWDYPPIDRLIPDAHRIARVLAEGRLEHELARLRRSGIDAGGEVVDALPVDRARELLHEEHFDGVDRLHAAATTVPVVDQGSAAQHRSRLRRPRDPRRRQRRSFVVSPPKPGVDVHPHPPSGMLARPRWT